MESKEFWKLIGKMFGDEQLGVVRRGSKRSKRSSKASLRAQHPNATTRAGDLFGLTNPRFGCAHLGSVRLSELESIKGPLGLGIERDRSLTTTKTICTYATEAHACGRITT